MEFANVGESLDGSDETSLKGHGVHRDEAGGSLSASVAGRVARSDRLVRVVPVRGDYVADVGHVLIGRVVRVTDSLWSIDIGSPGVPASLALSATHLPFGEHRRRTEEDSLSMRSILREGDLVSAEVQSVKHGRCNLHTRTLNYGRLLRGILVRVDQSLIRRSASHLVSLPDWSVSVILACNGWIWLSHLPSKQEKEARLEFAERREDFTPHLSDLSDSVRMNMARVRSAILSLNQHFTEITRDSITQVCRSSEKLDLSPLELLEEPHSLRCLKDAGVLRTSQPAR